MLGQFGSLVSMLPPAIALPGWNQYVNFLEWALDDVLAQSLGSAGLAVILFTIVIKTLLVPLTVQSLRSSKAMQELQPKIKELQKKHGKDRQRLSQETMRLYSENHVNPMAGCLPMLLQIPIFFGLYKAIDSLSNGKTAPWNQDFLWLNGLGEADPYKILPIMAGLFQFVQTKMMRPVNQGKITDPQQAMMNTMMNFMPLMVIVFGWTFASGAVIYWATQSVFSVIQQWFITGWGSMKDWVPGLPDLPEHRRLGYRPPRPVTDPVVMSGAGAAPVRARGVSGWVQRKMEEAQTQAQTRAEAQGGSGGGRVRTPGGATADPEPIEATGTVRAPGDGPRGVRTPTRDRFQAQVDATSDAPARTATANPRPTKRASRPTNGGRRAGGANGVRASANGDGRSQAARKGRAGRRPDDAASTGG